MRESEQEEERQRATENAGRAVERMIRLLADLRKLSDLGERPLERLPVDMPDLIAGDGRSGEIPARLSGPGSQPDDLQEYLHRSRP